MNLTARPAKSSRFVIWYGKPRTEEAEERDRLLGRLNLPDMSALHGVSDELLQSDLREETAFFLEYTGLGKLCVAIRHNPDARMNSHKDTVDQSLATLELSVRASNCLKHAVIGTITDLVRWSPEQLLDLPNAGRKTIDEITDALLNRDIIASSPIEPFSTATAPSLDSTSEPPLKEFRLETLLSTAEAGLSEPLRSRLKLIGIRSLADIVQQEASLVRTTADLQPAELEELANALRSRGLRWGMKLPEWQREHFSELVDAFALELQEAIHVSSAPILDSEEPAIFEVANSLNDELESLFPQKLTSAIERLCAPIWDWAAIFH